MPVLQKLLCESNATLNQTVEVFQKMTLAPLLATPDFYTAKTISGQIKIGARLEAVAAVMQPSEPREIVYFSAIFDGSYRRHDSGPAAPSVPQPLVSHAWCPL